MRASGEEKTNDLKRSAWEKCVKLKSKLEYLALLMHERSAWTRENTEESSERINKNSVLHHVQLTVCGDMTSATNR